MSRGKAAVDSVAAHENKLDPPLDEAVQSAVATEVAACARHSALDTSSASRYSAIETPLSQLAACG